MCNQQIIYLILHVGQNKNYIRRIVLSVKSYMSIKSLLFHIFQHSCTCCKMETAFLWFDVSMVRSLSFYSVLRCFRYILLISPILQNLSMAIKYKAVKRSLFRNIFITLHVLYRLKRYQMFLSQQEIALYRCFENLKMDKEGQSFLSL